jgi:hypothetical protein
LGCPRLRWLIVLGSDALELTALAVILGTSHLPRIAIMALCFQLWTRSLGHRWWRLVVVGLASVGVLVLLTRPLSSLLPVDGATILLRNHVLLIVGLGGSENPEIMLSVLIITLGHHDIAAGMGVTSELHVFVRDGLRCAANLHIRTVTVIDPVYGVAASAASAASTTTTTTSGPSAPAPAA